MCELLQKACNTLPDAEVSYAEAYRRLVKNDVEHIPIAKAGNRVVATGIVPYPPGIPLLAPGENAGKSGGPVLQYLRCLQDFDNRFPGFSHDTHGIEMDKGEYMMYVLKER